MNKELYLESSKREIRIALLEDKQLVEYHTEPNEVKYRVGDVIYATTSRILGSINAAFINTGEKKDGFLHYKDLGTNALSWMNLVKRVRASKTFSRSPKDYYVGNSESQKISEVVKSGQAIPVQVVKEPIGNKGLKLSMDISIPGRFLVLVPFSDEIYVSRNIRNLKEKRRLARTIKQVKPEKFGVILRTVSENAEDQDLIDDFNGLVEKWNSLVSKLATAQPKQILLKEAGMASSLLRDILNDTFQSIYTNNEETYEELKNLVRKYSPQQEKIVKSCNDKPRLFEHFGINKQIRSSFGRKVPIKGGGYLIIEHTEALHVVDVNSGNTKSGSNDTAMDTAFAVNMNAAAEIVRQIRLRDLGGIIVVDFIDMDKSEHRNELYTFLKESMAKDKAKHKILPPSKFGLVQITRQRIKPEKLVDTVEQCPICEGSGEVRNSMNLLEDIEKHLDYLITEKKKKNIVLEAHPYFISHIREGWFSYLFKWFIKYKQRVKVRADENFHLLEYRFASSKDGEVYISSE